MSFNSIRCDLLSGFTSISLNMGMVLEYMDQFWLAGILLDLGQT